MNGSNLPRHVAVIMDGNGRWAEKQGLPRTEGHVAGAKNVPIISKHLFDRGVEVVSLYALSGENLSRERSEVEGILFQVKEFIGAANAIFGDKVRLVVSGDLSAFGQDFARFVRDAESLTRSNSPHTINILLNYSGRAEILRAARLLSGKEITEQAFREALYNDLPDPDLIIRTGGEARLSGFMPFQSAYSELYFCQTLFPDFSVKELDEALEYFSKRLRKFGGVAH